MAVVNHDDKVFVNEPRVLKFVSWASEQVSERAALLKYRWIEMGPSKLISTASWRELLVSVAWINNE
jgi:hypothetical protein